MICSKQIKIRRFVIIGCRYNQASQYNNKRRCSFHEYLFPFTFFKFRRLRMLRYSNDINHNSSDIFFIKKPSDTCG